jgi:hypothetical protein
MGHQAKSRPGEAMGVWCSLLHNTGFLRILATQQGGVAHRGATHYTPGMAIYIFWAEVDASVLGFTADQSGANLPTDLAPWCSYGTAGLRAGFEAGAFPEVPAAIQAHGFCVVRTRKPA